MSETIDYPVGNGVLVSHIKFEIYNFFLPEQYIKYWPEGN